MCTFHQGLFTGIKSVVEGWAQFGRVKMLLQSKTNVPSIFIYKLFNNCSISNNSWTIG
jgi:hypothetical protein